MVVVIILFCWEHFGTFETVVFMEKRRSVILNQLQPKIVYM